MFIRRNPFQLVEYMEFDEWKKGRWMDLDTKRWTGLAGFDVTRKFLKYRVDLTEDEMPGIIVDINMFIDACLSDAERSQVVIGLSGGLDSAVVSAICANHLGPENVKCLIMPSNMNSPEDENYAEDHAKQFGMSVFDAPISCIVDSFYPELPARSPLALGNIMARIRMTLLYNYAEHFNALVCGTDNQTESDIGYFTKYGDGGVDFNPIGHLYKTQVRQLAKYLGIDDRIINRPPSAGLWEGQTDEDEIGLSYENLDILLYVNSYSFKSEFDLFNADINNRDLAEITGIPAYIIEKVLNMGYNTTHKREIPYSPISLSRKEKGGLPNDVSRT